MDKELSWDYWTDRNIIAKTGKFYLYRNSIYLGSDNLSHYKYSIYPKTEENAAFHITNTPPVASGITAFFAAGLGIDYKLYDELRLNRLFESEKFYRIYLKNVSKWTFLENDRAPVKKPDEEVNYKFLCEHIQNEKNCLIASEPYYSEFFDEQDKSIKEKIHEYVLGYISWIERKVELLSPEAQITISKNDKPGIMNSQQDSINETSIISSYLIKLSSFLNFFIWLYNLQLDPDSNWIVAKESGLGDDRDSKFEYYIKSDSTLADIEDFRKIIADALLFPGVDKRGLRSLINGLYQLTEQILSLPSQDYILYSLSHVVPIMLEYRSNKVTYYPLGSVIPDHSLIFYDNFKFFDFVKEMNGFLKLIISQASLELNNSNIPAGKIPSEDSVTLPYEDKKTDEQPLTISPKSPDKSNNIENKINDDEKKIDKSDYDLTKKGGFILPKKMTLHDIWLGTEVQYNTVISILTTSKLADAEIPFVCNSNETLTWNFPPKYGLSQYLKGFLHTCIKNNLIKNQSARSYKEILVKTFNIQLKSDDAFKSVGSFPPADKYLKPFKSFPVNVKK